MRPPARHPAASARPLRPAFAAALMLALVLVPAGVGATDIARADSAPPDPGCEWQSLSSAPLQVGAWSCVMPTGRWHVRAEPGLPGFALWVDDSRQQTVLHAVPRQPGAPLSSVVAALARAGHVPPDDCIFVRARGHPVPRGARAYEIRPAGARLAALRATPRDEVPDPPCGEYGWSTHGVRWFVVDPRRPRWVVYVNLGQDGTLIDPGTLRIGPGPP